MTSSAGASGAARGDLTILNASVLDGEEPREASVRMVDGVIVEVGDVTAGEQTIDARGATLLPGLIDAHFHAYAAGLTGPETDQRSYIALNAARRLGAALRRGFTTVRDVAGGDPGLGRAIEERLFPSPRYLYTGPALSQTGGHGDPRHAEDELCFHGDAMTEVVDGADALRVAVRDRLRQGAHAIKVMASGGVVSLTDPIEIPQYTHEELRVVVEEATRRGSYVAAHAYSPAAVAHAVGAGIRSIEHGNLLDAPTVELMSEHGAFLVPTLAAYDAMNRRGAAVGLGAVAMSKNAQVLSSGRRAIELALKAGVPVGFGSDLMGPLEDEQLRGLRLQAEVAGLQRALHSATRVNAALIGRDDLGRIEVGATADLLLLEGDLLRDEESLFDASRPRTVIRAGVPL